MIMAELTRQQSRAGGGAVHSMTSGHWPCRGKWAIGLRETLVKIGAKVVNHGRYVTFQLAEVAVPRDLFREILRLVDRLRRSPAVPT